MHQQLTDPWAGEYVLRGHILKKFHIGREQHRRWMWPKGTKGGGRDFPPPVNPDDPGRKFWRVADILEWERRNGMRPANDNKPDDPVPA